MLSENQPPSQYDATSAAEYKDIRTEEAPLVAEVFLPAVGEMIDRYRPTRLIDFGCGTGVHSRNAARHGAQTVLGVDLSADMVALATQQEDAEPLGIEYREGDMGNLKKYGEFDMATAVLVLHYSKTKEELLNMCRTAALNLTVGGHFVFIINNPEHPTQPNPKYGTTREWKGGDHSDGAPILVTFNDANGKASKQFLTTAWFRETYTEALQEASFAIEDWKELTPQNSNDDFWGEYTSAPPYVLVNSKKI